MIWSKARGAPAKLPKACADPWEALYRSMEGQAEQETRITKPITSLLQSVARQHCPTLNTLGRRAWALLLGRYPGEDDVVLGAVQMKDLAEQLRVRLDEALMEDH